MILAPLADLKTWLNLTGTTEDALLRLILEGVSAAAQTYCRRELLAADRTEYYDGGGKTLILRAYPIIYVTRVSESIDSDWDDEDPLTENADYLCVAETGELVRLATLWLPGRRTVEVQYRGGYADPESSDPGSDDPAIPADLQRAVLLQARFEYLRRDRPGQTQTTSPMGGATYEKAVELLPEVRRTLDLYRRYAL